MTEKKSLRPDTLFSSTGFGFAQVVTARPGRLVYCAGQTAWNKDMQIASGTDFPAQLEQAFGNVRLALAAAGAGPDDVVRITLYVVDYRPEYIEVIGRAMNEFFDQDKQPASTVLGVQSLALPEFLVEIEATAMVAD